MTRFVVLASGAGTNAAEIIAACDDGRINGTVAAVVTNRSNAGVVSRAQAAGVGVETVTVARDEERVDFDARLATVVASHSPDIVVLAGWMRVLSSRFLDAVGVPVVNLHPALPGDLPGVGAIERAFAEKEAGRTSSGVMVHLVPDEGIDSGPVLASAVVPLLTSDTIAEFAERIHVTERRLLVEVLSGIHLRIELTEPTRRRRGERLP